MLANRFWGRGPSAPFPNITSPVYNMPTVSTISRPRRADRVYLGQTTDRNSYDPRVNGRGIRVNGVAFGVKCAYSCILGAFGPRPGATRPPPGVLRTPGGGGPDRGGGQSSHIPYNIYIYIYIYIYIWHNYCSVPTRV